MSAEEIAYQHSNPKNSKNKSRWDSGVCSICGQWIECITQEHAKEHGYKNADEMAKAGVVK